MLAKSAPIPRPQMRPRSALEFLTDEINPTAPIVVDSISRDGDYVRCAFFVQRRTIPASATEGPTTTETILCTPGGRQLQFETSEIIDEFFSQNDSDTNQDTDISICSVYLPTRIFPAADDGLIRFRRGVESGMVYRMAASNLFEIIQASYQGITPDVREIRYSHIETNAFNEWQETQKRIASRILEESPQLKLPDRNEDSGRLRV